MALSETQIVRYSRQILLREVGGVGQEKLLSARLRFVGDGEALRTAAAYAAAGGSGVEAVPSTGRGFPVAFVEDAPRTAAPVLVSTGDAAAEGEDVILIRRGAVVFGDRSCCRACLAASASAYAPADGDDPDRDLLGALAVVVAQRWTVIGPASGQIRLGEDGGWETAALTRCGRCG